MRSAAFASRKPRSEPVPNTIGSFGLIAAAASGVAFAPMTLTCSAISACFCTSASEYVAVSGMSIKAAMTSAFTATGWIVNQSAIRAAFFFTIIQSVRVSSAAGTDSGVVWGVDKSDMVVSFPGANAWHAPDAGARNNRRKGKLEVRRGSGRLLFCEADGNNAPDPKASCQLNPTEARKFRLAKWLFKSHLLCTTVRYSRRRGASSAVVLVALGLRKCERREPAGLFARAVLGFGDRRLRSRMQALPGNLRAAVRVPVVLGLAPTDLRVREEAGVRPAGFAGVGGNVEPVVRAADALHGVSSIGATAGLGAVRRSIPTVIRHRCRTTPIDW